MRHSGGVYFYVQFPETGQNPGAPRGDVEAPPPCDHVVGATGCDSDDEALLLVNASETQRFPLFLEVLVDRFNFCPRCGARLEER